MDTEALAIGALPELSRTSTAAPVLKPSGTNPGGTAPVGKLIRVAKIWGGAAAEELPPPPPPPLQAASSRHAAAELARAPSLLWDSISSLSRSPSFSVRPCVGNPIETRWHRYREQQCRQRFRQQVLSHHSDRRQALGSAGPLRHRWPAIPASEKNPRRFDLRTRGRR